jgi:leader peptidase (prepilin peptidase)/N-methyltransferase
MLQNMAEHKLLGSVALLLAFLVGAGIFYILNPLIEELPREEETTGLGVRLKERGKELRHITRRRGGIALLGGVLTVAVVLYYGVTPAAITMLLVLCVLNVIAWIDIDTQYIPPELNILLFLLGVVSIWTMPGPTLTQRIIGIFCISLPLLLIVLVVPEGFGLGDIKMMAAAGFLLGWKATLTAFFIGLITGGAYGVYLLLVKKKKGGYHFALGPFLSVGIAVALYANIGTACMNRYIEMIEIIVHQ